MKESEKISNENLNDVSGGNTVEMTYYATGGNYIFLSPEEYNILFKAGYIDKDNKFKWHDSYEGAKSCLESHGYNFDSNMFSVGDSRTIKASSDLTPIKIVD